MQDLRRIVPVVVPFLLKVFKVCKTAHFSALDMFTLQPTLGNPIWPFRKTQANPANSAFARDGPGVMHARPPRVSLAGGEPS
jgi:hypothetical protein